MNFKTGDIVHHKLMGPGIFLKIEKIKDEELAKVRLKTGSVENFYPEELETEEVVKSRKDAEAEYVRQLNEENRRKMESIYGL